MPDTERLKRYHDRRDFRASPEPSGDAQPSEGSPVFVIQKHDASSLHYDLRLEVEGVLKSWSIPKGPSTDPRQRRLAIQTEDHPIEYADFEGVIPEGEYGAGTVIVWDHGTFQNLRAEKEGDGASLKASLEEGKLEVWLNGEKLRGGYALIHWGEPEKNHWLLIKMQDEQADARRKPTRTQPLSSKTGRTLDEVRNGSS